MWFPNTAVMMFMMDVMDKVISEMKDAVVVGSLGDNQINAEEEAKKVSINNSKSKNIC